MRDLGLSMQAPVDCAWIQQSQDAVVLRAMGTTGPFDPCNMVNIFMMNCDALIAIADTAQLCRAPVSAKIDDVNGRKPLCIRGNQELSLIRGLDRADVDSAKYGQPTSSSCQHRDSKP